MQSSVAHRSLAACPALRNRVVPAPCKLVPCRIGLRPLLASSKPEQPTASRSAPSNEGAADAAVVVEPAVVAEEEVASTTTSPVQDPDFPELPLSTNRAAGTQYLAVGAAYAVAAGAVAVAALQGPGLLLSSPAAAADPWSSVLLGCLAATYLRAAGVFLQLKAASDAGELLCWRHQRLAMGAAAYGVVAVLSQVAGLASPQLLGLQLLLAAASAAVVANVARSAWAVRPFVSSLTEGRSPGEVLAAVAGAAAGSVSTVAGLLLTTTMAVSLYGLFTAVFAPAPALPAAIGAWPGTAAAAAAMDGSAAGLRRLAASGLLLTAAASHALLDFAGGVRQEGAIDVSQVVKKLVVMDKVAPLAGTLKYFMPNPTIYSLLNAGFVVAAVLQSFFLYIAPVWGVNVNWDTALWGPLYGTTLLGLVYGLVALTRFDWSSVLDVVLRVACWFAELTMWFWDSFVWKFSWSEKTRRA
ncbi:hypothetical protein HYH02_000657 [Chlamydomonas schloesseri]|uniref:Uncharacterized protein n=1 Tax=Chlamydomonas schloesseri TaxID=2026947 RepID=A0A835WW30_9CHLO|nr:hypothetical protein HYH02_000657 [Chlamydomonas schloesseri]|eukprot:KAG2454825.1 hypothetical protein HYH02_000657 [Chlamydomonas schloesseri]